METKNSITVFENLHLKQKYPDGLLISSQQYLKQIQEGKLIDDGMFIYAEVRTEENVAITGTINDAKLIFHKVFGTKGLYKAKFDGNLLYNDNIVELNLKFRENGKSESVDKVYRFGKEFDVSDKDSMRITIEAMFREANLKELPFDRPVDATGDYSLTGKLIALAKAGEISTAQCVTYRDLFEKSEPEN